jgi:CrcB protein
MLQWAMGISLAGLVGIWARIGLVTWLTPLTSPVSWLPVGLVNVLGCLGIGCLFGLFSSLKHPQHWETVRVAMAMGFLGGFTTFSSFAWDAFILWQQWRTTQANDAIIHLLLTLLLQPTVGLIAVATGFGIGKVMVVR